jgi:hypothetical protein
MNKPTSAGLRLAFTHHSRKALGETATAARVLGQPTYAIWNDVARKPQVFTGNLDPS